MANLAGPSLGGIRVVVPDAGEGFDVQEQRQHGRGGNKTRYWKTVSHAATLLEAKTQQMELYKKKKADLAEKEKVKKNQKTTDKPLAVKGGVSKARRGHATAKPTVINQTINIQVTNLMQTAP